VSEEHDLTAPIVLGRIDESFHQVAAALVEETLLRLGHTVEVRQGMHPEMYPLLGRGELDLFATSWLPGGHGAYWPQIRDTVIKVSPLYDGARFFWAVPGYIPVGLVRALPDLARADVTERMSTLVVQGATPGAGLTVRSQQLVREYGLDEVGWSYRVGGLADIIQTIDAGMIAGEWFVTPLWQPQYLNDVHDLRPLDDPKAISRHPTKHGSPHIAPASNDCPSERRRCCARSTSRSPTSARWTVPSILTGWTHWRRRVHGWMIIRTPRGPGSTQATTPANEGGRNVGTPPGPAGRKRHSPPAAGSCSWPALVVGAAAEIVFLNTVGSGQGPSTPQIAMFTNVGVVVKFWLAIVFEGWPFARISNGIVATAALLLTVYVVALLL
jgi:glycine betaine/proline transport system substrate-binding protein